MSDWQKIIILVYLLINLFAFIKGYRECTKNKNPFGLAGYFNFFGIFVWGDAVAIGLFWVIASIVVFIINDWILFLLALSFFWLVRGVGEMIYWLNQQFSNIERNPPHTLFLSNIFPSDSIWFIYQIVWQCVTVVAAILSIYFAKSWLATI